MTQHWTQRRLAWAVSFDEPESGPRLLGIFWMPRDYIPKRDPGCTTALCRTREEARALCKRARRAFPSAKVVRVRVSFAQEEGR